MTQIDKAVLEELKKNLEQEAINLEGELKKFAKPTGTLGDYETQYEEIGKDEDENALEVKNYSDNLALEDNLEQQLKEVRLALERIKNGTYGICENCGEPISLERLKAYPAARTCVRCK